MLQITTQATIPKGLTPTMLFTDCDMSVVFFHGERPPSDIVGMLRLNESDHALLRIQLVTANCHVQFICAADCKKHTLGVIVHKDVYELIKHARDTFRGTTEYVWIR